MTVVERPPHRESLPTRPPTRRTLRFAPLSREHSTPLRVAMGYFTLTGGTSLVGGAGAVAAGVAGALPGVPAWVAVVSGLGTMAVGVGALWTARLLEQRRRLGGLVAVATLLAPVVHWAAGDGPAAGVLLSLAGAIVVTTVWDELE